MKKVTEWESADRNPVPLFERFVLMNFKVGITVLKFGVPLYSYEREIMVLENHKLSHGTRGST